MAGRRHVRSDGVGDAPVRYPRVKWKPDFDGLKEAADLNYAGTGVLFRAAQCELVGRMDRLGNVRWSCELRFVTDGGGSRHRDFTGKSPRKAFGKVWATLSRPWWLT